MICCQWFANATKVLLCRTNRYKLENMNNCATYHPRAPWRILINNLVNWVPHHGAKFTLSYKYCNSISTHEATYMPQPSGFIRLLKAILYAPSFLNAHIYPIFLLSINQVIEGPSTLVMYGAKTFLRKGPSYNKIDAQQGGTHVKLCPIGWTNDMLICPCL